ncbi:MAG TPA: nucleoside triphosphate pyrophosphatase [Solirubrobacteraceae bacterium]|nr:nucleoside triphosphate pyrophosphatase [Solirubrobacteraceae bacterium]
MSSTARTRTPRRSGRSRSSSPTCDRSAAAASSTPRPLTGAVLTSERSREPPVALILASRSPQRRAILEQLGIPFSVVPTDVEEISTGKPERVAVENARRKALAGAATASGPPVLGVDTVVALNGEIHGKPADRAAARRVLEVLSGQRHLVVSGLAVAREGREPQTAVEITAVDFRPLEPGLLDWYLASGEWRERAGGYAIQGRGAALVRRIEGDYLNVVGLPVVALLELLPGLLRMR